MEMEKVPALGYRIVGLPIAGLQRRLEWRNLLVPLKVWRSIRLARKTIREFGADAVVGFGGYASAPVLWAAQRMGVPTLIQEQNSYAGVTNKILAKGARRICTAYEGWTFPAQNPAHGQPAAGALLQGGGRPGRSAAALRLHARQAGGAGGRGVARHPVAQRNDETLDLLARWS